MSTSNRSSSAFSDGPLSREPSSGPDEDQEAELARIKRRNDHLEAQLLKASGQSKSRPVTLVYSFTWLDLASKF